MPFKDPEKRKQYHKQYSLNWKTTNRHRINESMRIQRENMKQWLLEQKQGKSCIECSENDPKKLDFHHLDPSTKIDGIAHMLQSCPGPVAKERTLEEMRKCILLCKPCHKKKNLGRPKGWGVRENARRYPLANCIYLARWSRTRKMY